MTDPDSPEDESLELADIAAISNPYKVLGRLPDVDGIGVIGKNTASSGSGIGVKGVTEAYPGVETSDPPAGVVGKATSGSGRTYGVEGITDSEDGAGVFARASNFSGGAEGIIAEAEGSGRAILARGDTTVEGSLRVFDVGASVYRNTSQSVGSTAERVKYNHKQYDDRVEFNTSTWEYTVDKDGKYEVDGQVRWSTLPNSGKFLELELVVDNGSSTETRARNVTYVGSSSWTGLTMDVSKTLELFTNDKLWVNVRHSDTGSTYDLDGGKGDTYLTVSKVG